MTDDPMEWLVLALDDDEPTIPDAPAWPDALEQTRPTTVYEDDDEPPEAEWELEIESEMRPPLRASHG